RGVGGRGERRRLFVPDVLPGDVVGAADGVGEPVEAVPRQTVDGAHPAAGQRGDDLSRDGGHPAPSPAVSTRKRSRSDGLRAEDTLLEEVRHVAVRLDTAAVGSLAAWSK